MESSYPYSVPPLPGRAMLADMILWYANPDLRRELLDPDSTLTTELIDRVLPLAQSLGSDIVLPCDVTDPASIDALDLDQHTLARVLAETQAGFDHCSLLLG